jgi:hypothetical protein
MTLVPRPGVVAVALTLLAGMAGNPDRQQSDMSNQKPFDMPAMHIFKIWGGQLHEIEAIGIMAPLNSPTGWE